ncbi:MAG: DUF898 family protein [Crocinitomicaceae bacterium]
METNHTSLSENKTYDFKFIGNGKEFFSIFIVNWLLTVVTLGIYYPWAKANRLQYIYGNTELEKNRFKFSGTGKEMFKGMLIAIAGLLVIFGIIAGLVYLFNSIFFIFIIYLVMFALIPFAIHGTLKYRMSRTTWRGIRFGYRGNRVELIQKFIGWAFLTLITFGIYGAWMTIKLRTYAVSNVKMGSAQFKFKGDGGTYFGLIITGYLLTLVTLGIYSFWWRRDLYAYHIENSWLELNDQKIQLEYTAKGMDFLVTDLLNALTIVFTLGFGFPWAAVRTLQLMMNKIELKGNINFDQLEQTENNYKDATGEDIGDMLNLDFGI